MAEEILSPEARLLEEVQSLGVEDILALCYAFQHRPERPRLYLDILRKRGGERAQFACCLLCFDLARQGDPIFQKEFAYLADTVRALSTNLVLVSALVGSDPYLRFLWELCQAQLELADPRFAVEPAAEATPVEAIEVELLSDDDFSPDFGISIDERAIHQEFEEAVEAFLGSEIDMPIYDPEAGFRLRHDRDVERIERFLRALDS